MKLSVLMVTYNQERFIAQAIESVLAQKVNFEYELVIGEDCSTDSTRAIVTDFGRRYPDRIIPVLRNKNLGARRNFRETLSVCKGRYLTLLEGDDYWLHEGKLQMQVDWLDAHPECAVCCGRTQVLDQAGKGCSGVHPTRPSGNYTMSDLFETNWVAACTVMYRWDRVGPLPNWILNLKMGDWPLHILVGRTGNIRLMDEVMSVYRIHPAGVWSSLSTAEQFLAIREMLQALDEHFQFKYKSEIRRPLAKLGLDLAVIARADGQGSRQEAAGHILYSLRHGGFRLPGSRRLLAGLVAYVLIGSWYKLFSRSKNN